LKLQASTAVNRLKVLSRRNIEFTCADKERDLRSVRKKHGYGAQHAADLLHQCGAFVNADVELHFKADWSYGMYFPALNK